MKELIQNKYEKDSKKVTIVNSENEEMEKE